MHMAAVYDKAISIMTQRLHSITKPDWVWGYRVEQHLIQETVCTSTHVPVLHVGVQYTNSTRYIRMVIETLAHARTDNVVPVNMGLQLLSFTPQIASLSVTCTAGHLICQTSLVNLTSLSYIYDSDVLHNKH